jgi:alpha,alpha-trehalase
MTSRFHDRCLDYLPVDLNCCLYKYEIDLANAYTTSKNSAKAAKFRKQAEQRRKNIQELMWNEKLNFFFDYNYQNLQHSHFYSVAGFYPLWCRLATPEQASLIREHILPRFEYEGGITNTQPDNISPDNKQHDHPNGWPHQQWIVVKGLLNYGYRDDAERIARKWVDMNLQVFEETGKFWEKYNVVTRQPGGFAHDRYITQTGFGWTNAIFVRMVNEFGFK